MALASLPCMVAHLRGGSLAGLCLADLFPEDPSAEVEWYQIPEGSSVQGYHSGPNALVFAPLNRLGLSNAVEQPGFGTKTTASRLSDAHQSLRREPKVSCMPGRGSRAVP